MSGKNPKQVEISENPIYDKAGNRIGTFAVLIGGIGHPNPKDFMDDAVSKYTGNCLHNQFIESHLDMPWVRIVIDCINELNYKEFNDQRLEKNDENERN